LNRFTKWINHKETEHYTKKLNKITDEIKSISKDLENLSTEELSKAFQKYKNQSIEQANNNLKNVYAIVYVLFKKIYNITLHDVQLHGAIALYDGNIAEMRTGEGKTYTSALPTILNATIAPTHVVTVNEYLAKRDKEELEPLYKSLGFTVGLNLNEMNIRQKRTAYDCDIMYSTANELGFDYLKDNMVPNLSYRVNQHGYNSTLIDEVDLVLIDEARTPLIIGQDSKSPAGPIMEAQNIVSTLSPETDLKIDYKSRSVSLTNAGAEKVANAYNLVNIYDEDNIGYMHLINEALLANFIYKENVDYAITKGKNKEVCIIDSFTGRMQPGRRFSNGLHQALEAKHLRNGVEIKEENKTIATITLQNYFRLYNKISGMSGTAIEEQNEFQEVYGLKVIPIQPNKPLIRKDEEIIAFTTAKMKWDYVVERIIYHNKEHRPVLVGTVSVEDSELLSKRLSKARLKHKVLNAKQNEEEAKIIAQAGAKNAITIATNMAGRGTDIKVDDDTELVVILTELNESSRIDNQLKGRTSRQGAPGRTETIISLEDSIFKRVNVDFMKRFNLTNPLPKQFIKAFKSIQEELESNSYSARRSALKFDDVIREQRNIFYNTRNKILQSFHNENNFIVELMYEALSGNEEALNNFNFLTVDDKAKRALAKEVLLYSLDKAWVDHIDKLEALKSGIGWRGQNGKNPIITYQNEANELYEKFKQQVYDLAIEAILDLKDYTALKTRNVYANKTESNFQKRGKIK
jgi:protein translocase subunit secA